MKLHLPLPPEREQTPGETRLQVFVLLFAAFVYMLPKEASRPLTQGYLDILVFAAVGSCFFRGCYLNRDYRLLGLLFALWFVVVNILNTNYSLLHPQYRTLLIRITCTMCIALPFARNTGDALSGQLLKRILPVFVTGFALLLWLGFFGALRGENICLPGGLEFGADYTYTSRFKLKIMDMHYYCTGYLSQLCFFLTLYLSVGQTDRKRQLGLGILLVTFLVGILITYSRSNIFSFAGGVLMLIFLGLRRFSLPKWKTCLVFSLIILLVAAVTLAGMNLLYKAVHSIRDAWYAITTFSSRPYIWSVCISAMLDNPIAWLRGFHAEFAMSRVLEYAYWSKLAHAHNGILQTLILTGLPGTVLSLWLFVRIIAASWRLYLAPAGSSVTAGTKILIVMLACIFAVNIMEPILVLSRYESLNLFFFLIGGYILEWDRHCFPKKPKNKE